MPTVLRHQGYRFYFYSHEPNEPPHIHVDQGDKSAKFRLSPVALARNFGYNAKELNALMELVSAHSPDPRIKNVQVDAERLSVDLMDGRSVSVPLAWYPRLFRATPKQRTNWEIAGGGTGIHWPDLDEDLSAEGLLQGLPASGRLVDAE